MAMKSVSVAMLKSNLSRYLAAAKNGKEIVITSHRHPIARIVPPQKSPVDDLQIIPAKKPVSSLRKIRGMNLQVDLLAELLADRRRR
jgi:prevent-host-death family protein